MQYSVAIGLESTTHNLMCSNSISTVSVLQEVDKVVLEVEMSVCCAQWKEVDKVVLEVEVSVCCA
eukprot:6491407-Amphidinium_carterae.3